MYKNIGYELPVIDHWPIKVLAKTFSEEQLCQAIEYVDWVLNREIVPRSEIYALGMGLRPTDWELIAVRNRLVATVCKIRASSLSQNIPMTGRVAA